MALLSLPALLTLGRAWAVVAWTLIGYRAAARGWGNMHRWALVLGATVGSMVCGFGG